MTRRWLRLDAEWDESEWLDGLSGEAIGCWPRLLSWVKLRGRRGRCTAPSPSVLARRWKVKVESVQELIEASRRDGAVTIEGGELVVNNWPKYQEPDLTAADRKRRQRSKQDGMAELSHGGHGMSRRDTVARDPRPPTSDNQTTLSAHAPDLLVGWLNGHSRVLDGCSFLESVSQRNEVFAQYGPGGLRPNAWKQPDGTSLPEAERPRLLALALSVLVTEGQRRLIGGQFDGLLRREIERDYEARNATTNTEPLEW